MKRTLCLIFPTYFESASLRILLDKVSVVLQPNFKIHVFLLDDSMGDDKNLFDLKASSNFELSIIQHQHRKGHQKAIADFLRIHLYQFSKDDFIVSLDADGEDRIEDICSMVKLLNDSNEHVVLAKRLSRNRNFSYKLLFLIYQILFWTLTSRNILSGNFACFKAAYLKDKISDPLFNNTYAGAFYFWSSSILFYPCHKGQRIEGETKMSKLALFKHALTLMAPFRKKIIQRLIIFLLLLFFSFYFFNSNQLGKNIL